MAADLFKGHSASWVAGYKEGNTAGQQYQLAVNATALWLQNQARIDREAWIYTKGVIFGSLLVWAAYGLGRMHG